VPNLRRLHPRFRPWAEKFFAWARSEAGAGLVVTSARRTRREQERLWRLSQSGQNNGLPAAPPGQSDHEVGLAWDMARLNVDPLNDPVLAELGAAWQRQGGRWWARDPVHFGAPLSWLPRSRTRRRR
jgi:hypothetical protein